MLAGQPIIILRDNVERTRGFEAQRSNIMLQRQLQPPFGRHSVPGGEWTRCWSAPPATW